MKKVNFRTETYDIGGGFYVDIVTKNDTYESWIYNDDYGQKEIMFGCPKEQQSYGEFVDLVHANIPCYMSIYINNVIEHDYDAHAIPFN